MPEREISELSLGDIWHVLLYQGAWRFLLRGPFSSFSVEIWSQHLEFPPSPFSLRKRVTHAFCRFGRRSLTRTACIFIIWPKEIDAPFSKLIRCFKVQRGKNQARELPTHCKTGPKLLNSKYEQSKEAIFLLTQVFFSAQFFSFLIRSIGFFCIVL